VTEEASIGAYVSLEVKGDAIELVRLINKWLGFSQKKIKWLGAITTLLYWSHGPV
jgi:hypothetical protein